MERIILFSILCLDWDRSEFIGGGIDGPGVYIIFLAGTIDPRRGNNGRMLIMESSIIIVDQTDDEDDY